MPSRLRGRCPAHWRPASRRAGREEIRRPYRRSVGRPEPRSPCRRHPARCGAGRRPPGTGFLSVSRRRNGRKTSPDRAGLRARRGGGLLVRFSEGVREARTAVRRVLFEHREKPGLATRCSKSTLRRSDRGLLVHPFMPYCPEFPTGCVIEECLLHHSKARSLPRAHPFVRFLAIRSLGRGCKVETELLFRREADERPVVDEAAAVAVAQVVEHDRARPTDSRSEGFDQGACVMKTQGDALRSC